MSARFEVKRTATKRRAARFYGRAMSEGVDPKWVAISRAEFYELLEKRGAVEITA